MHMKNIFTLLLLCVFAISVNAQDRYLDEVFSDITVTTGVEYGVNGTVFTLASAMEVLPESLLMDIYEPSGDTETSRPLVLLFHTGNFLPNVLNGQIAGTRQDSSVVEICTRLARRGYVAASCDYRLGWNPLADSQPIRALGLIQAAYRGIQDGRNAIRFFRSDAAGNNDYGIDTDRITAFGVGTGGYLVLGMAGLSEFREIIETTNGPAKFLLDRNGDGEIDDPMVVEAFHGDINGVNLTVTPEDGSSVAFGLPPGDTTNYSNFSSFDNDFNLCINVGGALGDISWLADNFTPILSVQSPFDQFAPYDDAVLIVPTTGDPVVQVQGSLSIGRAQEESGLNQIWKDATYNDAITQAAIDNSAEAGHEYVEGVFPFIRPRNSLGLDEGVVINWWDPEAISPAGAPWNVVPHPAGGTFHTDGLNLNEGMSAEKSRANIDDVLGYLLPRMVVALDLPAAANFTSSVEELLDNSFVKVSPNPISSFANISTGDINMIDVFIYDIKGQLVKAERNINRNNFQLNKGNLNAGMYNMQIRFEEGVTTTQIVVK